MEGDLAVMKVDDILKMYKNKIVSPGGEVYLNLTDSLDFIMQCEKNRVPIWGIDIVSITERGTLSLLDKTIVYCDQESVYSCSLNFLKTQMDDEWNYATIVTG